MIKYNILFCLIMFTSCLQTKKVLDFDEKLAMQYLIEQCSIGFRYPGTEEIEETRSYIKQTLAITPASISQQTFQYDIRGEMYDGVNIIASFHPRLSRRILIGAHYDTRMWADKDPAFENHNEPVLGANDAASGVAVLLALAKHLSRDEMPEYGIDLVFFDAEDNGDYGKNETWCHGARYFAKNLPIKIPTYTIIIDMIGDADLQVDIEKQSYSSNPALVSKIWNKAEQLGFTQYKFEIGLAIYDDHMPFIENGIPAIDIIDFQYPYWHTVEDTPDKCSAESLDAVGETLLNFIYGR